MRSLLPISMLILNLFVVLQPFAVCHAQPPTNAHDYPLAYITKRDGNFEIYRCDLSGKNHTRLTNRPGMDWNPQWNPGLNGILHYSQDSLEGFQVRLMDSSGKAKPFQVPKKDGFLASPDAKRIAYTKKVANETHIFVRDFSGGDERKLTQLGTYNGRPKWSPDSSRLAFISDRTGNNNVFVISVAENQLVQVTADSEREKYLAWSPDGKKLAYTKQPKQGTEDLYLQLHDKKRVAGHQQHIPRCRVGLVTLWPLDRVSFHAKRRRPDLCDWHRRDRGTGIDSGPFVPR